MRKLKKVSELRGNSHLTGLYPIFLLIIFILLLFCFFHLITGGEFLTAQNIRLVMSHCAIPTLTALGISLLFATGFVDLSIGAVIVLASNVAGEAAVRFGYPGMIISAIVTAFVAITISIQVTTRLKLPSWITGIGMAMVYEAVMGAYNTAKINSGTTVVSLGKSYRGLGSMPWVFIVTLIAVFLAWVVFTHTRAGINIRAIGSNATVAKMTGINENRVFLYAAGISAIFIGLTSAVNMSYSGKQLVSSGLGSISLIFEPLAILLLGQAFERKIVLPIGIFLCSLLISGLFNALTWLGVPSGTGQEVIMGLGVVICAIFAVRGSKETVK